jgi:hypothetical protein
MTDASILRQKQRERREWIARAAERDRLAAEQAAREQRRIDQTKNAWAEITAARANAVLAGYQHATYHAKAQKLIALDALINKS